jgi:hypothetical protein
MLFVYVHMSLSSELASDCVLFITATFNLSNQRLCAKANTLPTQGLTEGKTPWCLLVFSKFFKKFRQLCRDQSHKRKVF